jgi:hypothetical protein
MPGTKINTKVDEHIVLKKFHGDGPHHPDEKPLEQIEMLNGKVISHLVHGKETLAKELSCH